jgi:hypothetical protein
VFVMATTQRRGDQGQGHQYLGVVADNSKR